MTRFFFSMNGPNQDYEDCDGIDLPDGYTALSYAKRIVCELKEAGGYGDHRLKLVVQNDRRATIFSIPFW